MTTAEPIRADLLLCEYVRMEQGGKLSLLGFFPARRIRVPAETEVATFPLSLAFVIYNVSEGRFQVRVSLKSPNGKLILENDLQPDAVISKETKTHVTTVSFVPFQITEFGTYEATLKYGDFVLPPASFTIEKRTPPS